MSIKTKICGLTTRDAVTSAISSGADYIGFVFYPFSPRYLVPKKAFDLAIPIPPSIKKVAVLVDAGDEEIDNILKYFKADILQCHGKETPARIFELHMKYGLPVMKAIPVRSSDDVAKAGAYTNSADMLLFDAKVPTSTMPGGNGLAFDWTLLKERDFDLPWFLSGGLNIENVTEALKITGAKMVDVSSSLEIQPGIKDPELIRLFIEKVKQYAQ